MRQPARARGPALRRSSAFRRRRRGRSGADRSVVAAGLAAAAIIPVAVLVAGQARGYGQLDGIAEHVVYSAPTANDAVVALPPALRDRLTALARQHRSIAVTRIEGDGTSATRVVDLTPRAGSAPDGRVLVSPERAGLEIDRMLARLARAVNTPATRPGHALLLGLTRTDLPPVPTDVVSSGLDLRAPDDFRVLAWRTDPDRVVDAAASSGVVPRFRSVVRFYRVPVAGDQPQLGNVEKSYRDRLWTALLTAAGATSVEMADAPATGTALDAPSAPVVPVLAPPVTPGDPVRPVVQPDGRTVECSLPGTYFRFGSALLADEAATVRALHGCVRAASAAGAQFRVDGWSSYEGPLTAVGAPAVDDLLNRALSRRRAGTIAALLTDRLDVPPAAVTAVVGHGNTDLPDPEHPRDATNRTVRVTFTLPDPPRGMS